MLRYINQLNYAFWDENIWLSANQTWEDIRQSSSSTKDYTPQDETLLPILIAPVFIVIQIILRKYCFLPLAAHLGIKPKKIKKIASNSVLETVYLSGRKLEEREVVGLAKQLDLTERQVLRWLRVRRSQDASSMLDRFTEACWRVTYFVFSVSFWIYAMVGEPWVFQLDIHEIQRARSVSTICRLYLINSWSFTWSMLLTIFHSVKRKDFHVMFLHHVVAIVLLSLGWMIKRHRQLFLFTFFFDLSDLILETGKLVKYMNYHNFAQACFFLLVPFWIATRVILFPIWVLNDIVIVGYKVFTFNTFYVMLSSLNIFLYLMFLYWSYEIMRVAIKYMRDGELAKSDPRSCDEEDISDGDETMTESKKDKAAKKEYFVGN